MATISVPSKGILLALCLLFTKLDALVIEASNLQPFEKAMERVDQSCLVLFDVDETLITPKDLILNPYARDHWNRYAQETIKNPAIVPNYDGEYFFSRIFSKMEYEVVDLKVVEIIQSLQKQQIKTIAFTKMFTGAFGSIRAMEDWRLAHLQERQFDFSLAFPQIQEIRIDSPSCSRPFLFKQGLLCANKQDKGPVLLAFLEKLEEQIHWRPAKILFIDNRLDYLQSVEIFLQGTGIEFIGFHYREVELRPFLVNEELARFQLMHLALTGEWTSDGEALKLIDPCQRSRL